MKQFLIILTLLFTTFSAGAQFLEQGGAWTDTDGQRINSHGGSMLCIDSIYYWYGEHRPGFESDCQKGVSCYSSYDLKNWKNEGIVLELPDYGEGDLIRGCTIERPKVIYNTRTGKFIMWFHHELKGRGYSAARSAVAISNSPTGPFTRLSSGRINPGKYPLNFTKKQKKSTLTGTDMQWWTPEWQQAVIDGIFLRRDLDGGQMARDMTLFVDSDGKAYHIYSSEENLTLHIAELTRDYTAHTGRYIRIFPGGHNEAPVLFKHGGKYWLICSGCTGWEPNAARLFSADNIFGEWTEYPNPCLGSGADKTFYTQGAFHFRKDGNDYLVADQWRPHCLADSRTMVLPILYKADGTPVIVNP